MTKLEMLKSQLQEGKVYRRSDFLLLSKSVDRHLAQLVKARALTKLKNGLYYCPEKSAFGMAPPSDKKLVQAFLKDRRFLMTTPNLYNSLGLGTTQLYNTPVVYNHKRHGKLNLGGRVYDFRLKHHFPSKLTVEFLLVDLMNNLDEVAENDDELLKRVKEKALSLDLKKLQKTVAEYAGVSGQKFFREFLSHG